MTYTHLQPETSAVDPAVVDEAVEALGRGGLILFPTETVYGLGAAVGASDAVARLRAHKAAGPGEALVVHVPSPEAGQRMLPGGPALARRAMRRLLGGPVTLITEGQPELDAGWLGEWGLRPGDVDHLLRDGVMRWRCPGHPLTRAVLERFEGVVVGSGAARPGAPLPVDFAAAMAATRDLASEGWRTAVDGGRCRHGKPSTVVRVLQAGTDAPRATWRVEREGVYDERYIRRLMRLKILFVCSGNTCRSPMAQAMAEQMLAQRIGVGPADLSAAGYEVASAGVFASAGAPASEGALEAMNSAGIDLSSHRSRPLTAEAAMEADHVFGMTAAHVTAVEQWLGSSAGHVERLDPEADILDPIGGSAQDYAAAAEHIRGALERRIEELIS